jgi:hypothetical protein
MRADVGILLSWALKIGEFSRLRSNAPVMRDPLILSHKEVRAALRLARREIVTLNFGKQDTPLLQLIDRVQGDARTVAIAAGVSRVPERVGLGCPISSDDNPNHLVIGD